MELITAGISAGEAEILHKDGHPLTVEYLVVPTRADGERLCIGMMWPLASGKY
jgi:hypothetical protein